MAGISEALDCLFRVETMLEIELDQRGDSDRDYPADHRAETALAELRLAMALLRKDKQENAQ